MVKLQRLTCFINMMGNLLVAVSSSLLREIVQQRPSWVAVENLCWVSVYKFKIVLGRHRYRWVNSIEEDINFFILVCDTGNQLVLYPDSQIQSKSDSNTLWQEQTFLIYDMLWVYSPFCLCQMLYTGKFHWRCVKWPGHVRHPRMFVVLN